MEHHFVHEMIFVIVRFSDVVILILRRIICSSFCRVVRYSAESEFRAEVRHTPPYLKYV